jgi:hemin uptake protein HemP
MPRTMVLSPAHTRETLQLSRNNLSPAACPLVDSAELLQGQKAVQIQHNGSVYRLQATKLGKLILTK